MLSSKKAIAKAIVKNVISPNKLFYGDNIEVLRKYITSESIDLCYIDPPFNSQKKYNQIYNNTAKEDRAQAQAFIDTWTWNIMAEDGLKEILSNHNNLFTKQIIELIIGYQKVLGKSGLFAYIISMTLRVAEIYRVLKPTGSFYFHCDQTASHYIKLVIDALFCSRKGEFQNEIIWNYKRWTATADRYQRMHDTIFYYTKSDQYTFNMQYEDYQQTTLKYHKWEIDKDGREFYWKRGRNIEAYKVYKDTQGVKRSDVWDIPQIGPIAKERLGYPTQKPEILLDIIIKASSNEGDTVLDAFCGCGTTIAVAEQLSRKWIGIDITYQSISLILKRIEEHFGAATIQKIQVNGVPEDFESAEALAHKKDDRVRKEFEKWAVLSYSNNRAMINEKKGGDGGIDGIAYMVDLNDKGEQENKQILFSVKSDKTLAPKVIRELNGAVEREGAAMGILITLYPMDNLVKDSKKYGIYQNKMFGHSYTKIEVVSIQDIFNGNTMRLPTSLEVLKKAEMKAKNNQQELEFNQ